MYENPDKNTSMKLDIDGMYKMRAGSLAKEDSFKSGGALRIVDNDAKEYEE